MSQPAIRAVAGADDLPAALQSQVVKGDPWAAAVETGSPEVNTGRQMHADTPVWGILTFWSEGKGGCEDGTCHKRKNGS